MTIVYAPSSGMTAYNPAVLPTLVERFHETHPEIVVEIRDPRLQVGGFMRNLAGASDCFGCLPVFQESGSREAVLSLEPFLDADPSFSIDDFYPALLAPFIQQGQLLGLPGEARPEIIRYDKGLFDAAGVAYPEADWTTDDFLQTAIALTQRRGLSQRYGFLGATSEVRSLTLMMERWGGNLVDRSVDPPNAALNAPSTVGALRWYVDLSALYGVKPPVLASDRERSRLINRGRAAMWLVTESWELVSDGDETKLGWASVPAGAESTAGAYRYVDGHFISAHTQVGQACWEWIAFLTAQPETAWGVPARRSVVESEAYRQWVGEERAAVHEASVSGAERAPISANYGAEEWLHVVTLLLERAYERVIEGEATVEEALDAAQHTFDAYRACVVTREVTSDEAGWRACAEEADPDLADLLPGK
jgi:multiple sugar transport system substrate-binding protein